MKRRTAIRAGAGEGYALVAFLAALAAGCALPPERQDADTLVVFAAASLARPLATALDSFRAEGGAPSRLVVGGSLDLARRVTELGEAPDLVALADEEVFRRLLLGPHARTYSRFAANRLVIAYSDQSRGAASVDSLSWASTLSRDDVEIARADPARAPVGYRTLLAWRLAERKLGRPGLAKRLEERAPKRNMRGSESEVLALVESGTADFAWAYESSARAAGLRVLRLPAWMDFGDASLRDWYASESIGVPGKSVADTVMLRGEPIAYVLSVPTRAAHPQSAGRLFAYLLGESGQRVLERSGLDVGVATGTVNGGAKDP